MNPEVQVLEELTWVAPFGVRFWDVTAMAPAGAGLTVVAYPNAFPALRSTADVNRTGVYFFHGLPGMRRFENGDGDEDFWAALIQNSSGKYRRIFKNAHGLPE